MASRLVRAFIMASLEHTSILLYSHGPEMVRTRHAGDMSPCLTSATFVLQKRGEEAGLGHSAIKSWH